MMFMRNLIYLSTRIETHQEETLHKSKTKSLDLGSISLDAPKQGPFWGPYGKFKIEILPFGLDDKKRHG